MFQGYAECAVRKYYESEYVLLIVYSDFPKLYIMDSKLTGNVAAYICIHLINIFFARKKLV